MDEKDRILYLGQGLASLDQHALLHWGVEIRVGRASDITSTR